MAYFHCLIGGGSSGGGYTLTVTCDSQFAGTTITCTDGTTTLTTTCPSASPYEVEFDIPNGGDWTISGVVSGQTATTGVSIPTTATLEAIVQKTITIYSAKEDTITYTDIYGDTQTEVFASGQSSKQITVDIEPNGSSITFTSGVAKNPSNLSNYYSKTVTISSNTTDVYLMPDNALYWWGYEDSDLESNGFTFSGTKTAPTFNTTDVNLSVSASANYLCSINAPNAITGTAKIIGYYTNREGSIWVSSSKAISGATETKVTTSSALYSLSLSNQYIALGVSNGSSAQAKSMTINALWYE